MTVPMDMLLLVVGAGILQAVFLACLLFFHPDSDHSVNKFLTFYILSFCIPMLIPLVQHFFSWQFLIFLDPFLLLTAPLLYLYVRSFKEDITWRKAWPHFILFVAFVVFDVYLFTNVASKYPPTRDVPAEVIHNPSSMIRVPIRILQMFTYFILAGRALTVYQRSIQHLFSETSTINLSWVRWLINGFFCLIVVMAVLYWVILQSPQHFGLIVLINTAVVTPYIYAVTFKGVIQPTLWQVQPELNREIIFQEMHEAEETESALHDEETKVTKPAINPEKKDDILLRIVSLMENDKIFLQPELTLQDLADKLQVPSYQVSLAINEGLNKTFYDLVNGYRVEEAKRLLLDPKSKSTKILALAFDAGFNSKTTFNTVFKKFTGCTPTDFKDQHKKEFLQV